MNNFVFSQDPLLYTSMVGRQASQNEADIKRQLDDAIIQYQNFTQNQQPPQNLSSQTKDYLGEIDNMLNDLDEDVALSLSSDLEYLKLQEEIQSMIQSEIIKSVKNKINNNATAISKMSRIKELIVSAQKNKDTEDRKIMADINDYVKNYSDLTFNEYKQLKNNN